MLYIMQYASGIDKLSFILKPFILELKNSTSVTTKDIIKF